MGSEAFYCAKCKLRHRGPCSDGSPGPEEWYREDTPPGEADKRYTKEDWALLDEAKALVKEGEQLAKAGECEHEWDTFKAIKRYKPNYPHDYICMKCKVTRTVADFWKEEPPEHPNAEASMWARTRWPTGEWSPPIICTVSEAKYLMKRKRAKYLFFHHPDYIIEPPPVPEDEE